MVLYRVTISRSRDRVTAALLDAYRPWDLPDVFLGEGERLDESTVAMTAGDARATISVTAHDGGALTQVVVRHDPVSSPIAGTEPESGWREAWPILLARLKAHLEGVPLVSIPPDEGGPKDPVAMSTVLPASQKRVWAALTEPDDLGAWVAERADVALEPGGTYDWGWSGEGPTQLLALDVGRSLVTNWHFPDGHEGRVEWTVGADPGGARISLVHHGFGRPDEWPRLGYFWGWADFLQALSLYLFGAGASDTWRGRVADEATS